MESVLLYLNNNNIDNLVCMTRAEHVRLHKPRIKR